jgi:hypothetical protein
MLKKIILQKIQHSDGYVVQVLDRYIVEYFDKSFQAHVKVDFGTNVGVYRDSLNISTIDGREVKLGSAKSKEIFERIISDIEAMGRKMEIS